MATDNKAGLPADKIVRAAIYTRISNEEKARQESNSLESQRDICGHYIQVQRDKGWKCSGVYEDPGFSGKDLNRPGIQKLLSDVRAGKVDVVVTYKLDRISRSLKDFYGFWELLKSYNAAFVSATQSFDTSNSTGILMLNILLSFAQFERELAVERTAARMASRAEKGQWNGGWFPMGYQYVKDKKMLLIHPEEAKIVRKTFDLVSAGLRPAEVKNKLNALGFRTSARTVVRRNGQAKQVGRQRFDEDHVINIVKNPVYKGYVKHKTNIYPGVHKAIVDGKLWSEANKVLASRSPRIVVHKDDHVHLLKGLVRCGDCGLTMTPCPAGKKDSSGKPYLYYSCVANHHDGQDSKCKVRILPARPLEEAIKGALRKVGQNESILEDMIKETNRESAESVKPLLAKKTDLQAEITRESAEIKRLINVMKQADLVSSDIKDEYKKLLAAREQAQISLEKLQIDIERLQQKSVDIEVLKKCLQEFDRMVEALPLEDQKELMQLIIKEITVQPFDPDLQKVPQEMGCFTTKIRTKWYKMNLALYEVPVDKLNLAGASSEKTSNGCRTRI